MEKSAYLDKLKAIENEIERKDMYDILNKLLEQSYEYQNKQIDKLKTTLFEKESIDNKRYIVKTAVCALEERYKYSENFFPVIEPVAKSENIKATELEKGYLVESLFLPWTDSSIKQYLFKHSVIEATLITNEEEYQIQLKLVQNERYQRVVDAMNQLFRENRLDVPDIFFPDVDKFLDVQVCDINEEFSKNEIVLKIEYSLDNESKGIRKDIIPIWNIRKEEVKSKTFPVPSENGTGFKHYLTLKNRSNGYLVNHLKNGYSYMLDDKLIIRDPDDALRKWELFEIVQLEKKLDLEISKNQMKDSFLCGYGRKYNHFIRTKAELTRRIQAFYMSDQIEYKGFYFTNELEKEQNYIGMREDKDELYAAWKRGYVVLEFQAKELDNKYNENIVRYLIQEAKEFFLDRVVMGRLI